MPRGRDTAQQARASWITDMVAGIENANALSVHRGWIEDRKYMMAVRCRQDKCFVTRL